MQSGPTNDALIKVKPHHAKPKRGGGVGRRQLDKNIYIFGIAMDQEEKKEVKNEANKIYDVKEVFPSIYLATELSRNKL